MKRSERLEKINAINHGMETLAGANLANIQAEYANQTNQLEQLLVYKAEYADKFTQRMKGDVSPQELQDYRYFFASIDAAITQQQSMVNHFKKMVEKSREEWLSRHQEVQKINQVSSHLRRSEAVAKNRLEQKVLDEITAHFFHGPALAAKH
ncbi:MAG TPA: flagellar export protein FliJ [Candidatus Acidoferrum sp.]|nr:flagellar export protein FliJ [Candidatus Acidoferrum sp.]